MSMDPSMIAGTGLLEIGKSAQKSKAAGKANAKNKASSEAAQEANKANAPGAELNASAHARAYLRFLALSAQTSAKARVQSEDDVIDPNEVALLELVLLRWAVGSPMTVRQAIALAHLGSPATLHKRLMRLRNKAYLDLEHVSGDRRVKRLIAGPVGLSYMDSMGRHLMAARQGAGKTQQPS